MKSSLFSFGAALLVVAAGSVSRAEDATTSSPATAPAPAEVINLDIESALRMTAASSLSLRGGALGALQTAQLAREESGRFDPTLELSYNRALDTSTQPLDPFGTRPASAEVRTDDYSASMRGNLATGGTYRVGLSSTNQRGTFNNFADTYYTFLGVNVTQPLLRNFGTNAALAPLRIARAQGEAALWQYRQNVNDTLTEAAFAFYGLAFAQGSLRVSERSVALGEQLVEENQKRQERGSMSTQDVVEARARATRRKEVLVAAQLAVTEAENRLKRFIYADFSDGRDRHLVPRLDLGDPPTFEQLTALAATALEQRPDYRQARLNVEQRRIELGLQRNQLLPTVDLVGSYGYSGADSTFRQSFDQVRDAGSDSYSIGAVVSLPLPNRTALARRHAAELAFRRSEIALTDLEQEIQRQLADAIAAVEFSKQRVETIQEARSLAEQSLDAEEKRLRAGTSTTFYVLTQQDNLAEAQLRELRAIADLASAIADFHRLCGRTVPAYDLDPQILTPPDTR